MFCSKKERGSIYYFLKQEYILAKENLEWIYERQEEFESDFDDLLNEEFDRANILLDMIEKFSLIERQEHK